MLMADRIVEINNTGGASGKGQIIAELDINPDLWFFGCHFEGDPGYAGLSWSRCPVAIGGLLSGVERQQGAVAHWVPAMLNSLDRSYLPPKK